MGVDLTGKQKKNKMIITLYEIYGIQEGALVSWSKIWDRTYKSGLLARLKITLVVMLRSGVALTRDPLCHVTYDKSF